MLLVNQKINILKIKNWLVIFVNVNSKMPSLIYNELASNSLEYPIIA
jgi:hypothetical protein